MSFVSDCLSGKCKPDDIDDYVARWQLDIDLPGPLYAYLGMTEDEYRQWAKDASAIDDIIAARKQQVKP